MPFRPRRAPRRLLRPRRSRCPETAQDLLEDAARAALVVDDEDLHATSLLPLGACTASLCTGSVVMTLSLVETMSPGDADDEDRPSVALGRSIVQPWARTMRWVMARPRPVPRGLVVYQGAKTREGSPSKPGPVSQTVSSPPFGPARQETPTSPRPGGVERVGEQVDEDLGHLVHVAADGASVPDVDREGAVAERSREHLGAIAELDHVGQAALEVLGRHAAQARDEALEAIDLLAADVDVLVVEALVAVARWKMERKKLMG